MSPAPPAIHTQALGQDQLAVVCDVMRGLYKGSGTQPLMLRSYHREKTRSHQNSVVKRGWARLVVG